MTTFKQYLKESISTDVFEEEIDIIVDKIKSNCKPYISKLSKLYNKNAYLISGRGLNTSEIFIKKKVRKDRKPVNTNIKIHEYIDDVFYKIFKEKPRSNSLFAYQQKYRWLKETSDFGYGEPYIIFPIGKFKIFYHPYIEDFYIDIRHSNKNIDSIESIGLGSYRNILKKWDDIKYSENLIEYFTKIVNGYKIWDGETKISSEMMIVSDYVYMINLKMLQKFQMVDDFFKKIMK